MGVAFVLLAVLLLGVSSAMMVVVCGGGDGVRKVVVRAVHPEKLWRVHALVWYIVELLGLVLPNVASVALDMALESVINKNSFFDRF